MLVGRGHDLVVAGPSSRPASTMLQPSVVDAVSATCSVETPTSAATSARSSSRASSRRMNRCVAATPLLQPTTLVVLHRLDRRARERPDAPGLQVREALEHRELRACLLEGHAPDSADTASNVRRHARRHRRPARLHAAVRPVAGCGARPRRSRRRARDVAIPLRIGRRADRLRGPRVVLSDLVADGVDAACASP